MRSRMRAGIVAMGVALGVLAVALPACRRAAETARPAPTATAPAATTPATAATPADLGQRPAAARAAYLGLDTEIMPDVTVRKVRQATDELAASRRGQGEKPGPSLAVCQKLAAMSLVTRCVSIGAGARGEPQDRASFELLNPVDGRGVIHHYGSAEAFAQARSAFAMFEKEFGTFIVANEHALLIWAGAEQLAADQKSKVRALIAAQ